MRDSIAHLLTWALRLLLPAHGRHSGARPIPHSIAQPNPAPAPVVRRQKPWTTPSSAQARAIFNAPETGTLTPEQRERWWATAFAEIGVEYPYTYPGAPTYRPGAAA
ncbi:hypothetical protein [Streptomyces sp. NPDC051162]|uniref:hypothetical protein n=1 Tax=Streptomyces sp. NPDC051162 TaxID=3154747 RepID=UPI00344815DB